MIDVRVLIERASLLHSQGRVNDAIAELKKALQQEPQNGEALSLYARCLFDKKQYDEGLHLVDLAIASDPENSYYIYLKGFGNYRKDKNLAAIDLLHRAIAMDPYYSSYYGLLAIVLIEERRFDEGLEKANQGLAYDAENVTCLNARAIALNKLKRTEDAIETMQDALAKDPDNEFTHSTMAWNYLEKGRHREAAEHFREALRIDPGYANAQQGLKEALKSRIPPYRWLLQYSFWVSNKGRKAGWIIPLGLYLLVRILASGLRANQHTAIIGTVMIALYLLFVVGTWLMHPVANFFLLFHRDGKYALTLTEKWTALTVVSSLLTGLVFLILNWVTPSAEEIPPLMVVAFAFLLMAVPLGDLRYPLSFRGNGVPGIIAMVLVSLGLCTIVLSVFSSDYALISASVFLVAFVLNNWFGLFRAMGRRR